MLSLALIGACAPPLPTVQRRSDPLVVPGSRHVRPAPRLTPYVLRQGRLKDASLRHVVVEVDRPVLVETAQPIRAGYQARPLPLTVRLPRGGYVRAVRPAGKRYLHGMDLTTLGRYVRRRTTLYLRQGSQPIGVAYPGAFLPVYEDGRQWVRIGFPRYTVNSTMGNQHRRIDNRGGAPLAWVRARDLWVKKPPRLPRSDPWTTPAWDHYRTLYVTAGGQDYTTLICGPVRVIARRGKWVRLAQNRRGVELRGWASHDVHPGRGNGPCMSRTVAGNLQLGFGRAIVRPAHRVNRAPPPLVGHGGAPLNGPSGRRIGHLPFGTILEARRTGRSRFRAGPVVVYGTVPWTLVGSPRSVRALARPPRLRNPTRRPPPKWRPLPATRPVLQRFLHSVLGKKRTVWLRMPGQKRCQRLSFNARVRYHRGAFRTKAQDIKTSGCWRRTWSYGVQISSGAVLTLFGPSFKTVLLRRKCPHVRGAGGGGVTGWACRMQLVGVQADKLLLVPSGNGALSRYAEEDLAVWFFSKPACEARLSTFGMQCS